MVDSIGMYNGLNFKKGAREPTYYDLGAEGGMLTNTDYNSMGIDSMPLGTHRDKHRLHRDVSNSAVKLHTPWPPDRHRDRPVPVRGRSGPTCPCGVRDGFVLD